MNALADSTATTAAPLGPAFYRRIQDRLRHRLEAEGHDGLLMLATGNVVYATGFFHSANERPIAVYVPVEGKPVLFVPLLKKRMPRPAGSQTSGPTRNFPASFILFSG